MNSRKILILCDKNECNSLGRLSINFANALRESFDTHILWLKTPRFFSKDEEFDNSKYMNHEVWSKNIGKGFFQFPSKVAEVCKKINPDIVYFICPRLCFLMSAVSKAIPNAKKVVCILDPFAETLFKHSLKYKVMNRFFIHDVVNADGYLYISEWTRRTVTDIYGEQMRSRPGFVVGCPVDSSFYTNENDDKMDKTHFIKSIGLEKYKQFCLNVSIDEPRKNLKTFFKIAKERPDIAFVRIGRLSKKTKKELDQMNLLNVFHFCEVKIEDLLRFYRFTDLMIYPSFGEGFGLPPIEVLSCGSPAVCAANSAILENLNGVCPLVSPADDVNAYLEIVDKALAGKNLVNEKALECVLKKCSEESFKERVVNAMNAFI